MWRSLLVVVLITGACAGSPSTDPTTPQVSIDRNAAPSSSVSDVSTTTSDDLVAEDVLPVGFELTTATVTAADGTVCELCLWLAESAEQRSRGLMGVTDLGRADGMAFLYPTPHITRFWMKNTVLALSIAFYDPSGEFMESFDMEPCVTNDCLRYPTPFDFLIAVESNQGGLGGLGMLAGSTLELLDVPCRLGTTPNLTTPNSG